MASEQLTAVFHDEDLDDEDNDNESPEDEEDLDDDDALGVPEDEDDKDNETSPSSAVAVPSVSAAVTVIVPATALPTVDGTTIQTSTASRPTATVLVSDSSDRKRQRAELSEEKKPLDDSRRLFQRLWTDEDEIELLQGFLEYTAQRGSSHHSDTSQFYDQIRSKLQLDFNKNQLVEKLRRLKKKYRNVINKINSGKDFSFKSPHDQATFEISRKIWSDIGQIGSGNADDNALDDDELNPNPNTNPNSDYSPSLVIKSEEVVFNRTPTSKKRARSKTGMKIDEKRVFSDGLASGKDSNFIAVTSSNCDNNTNTNNNNNTGNLNIPGLIEETVRSCLSPLFKELFTTAMGGGQVGARGFGALPMNLMPLGLGRPSMLNFGIGNVMDEKWRKQQILELEVYSRRLGLVQEQIKAALEELRSNGG